MDSLDDLTFSSVQYSLSQSSSCSNAVSEIKRMLLSGDKHERAWAANNALSQLADRDGAIQMINSDICEFLCDIMLPFDYSTSETIYNCIELMVKFDEFFTHDHSNMAIEFIIRSMNLLIKGEAYDDIVRYPLQTLKLIVQRYVELNKSPKINFENLIDLLIVLLKNDPAEEIKYQTGEIINFLLDIELGNLNIIPNLGDICEKWFNVICLKKRNSCSLTKRIVNLGCAVSEKTLRYLRKKVASTSQSKQNKDFKSAQNNIIKNIITFLLELPFPDIQDGPYAIEEQEIQRLEHYFTSFGFILKDFSERQNISQKLSKIGHIQLISTTLSFSHRYQRKKLGKICVDVLTEILLSLSYDYFIFPDMWPSGRDLFSNEIIKGMSLLPMDSTLWAESLETNINPSVRLALMIYFFFYSVTSKSTAFSEKAYSSMVRFLKNSLGKDSSPLQVKIMWFIYATLQMSPNSACPVFNIREHKKLLDILKRQVNFSLIYTHHPVILSWVFSSLTVVRKIQCDVVKLWLEQRSADCTVLDDLVKKNSDVGLVLFEILQNEDEHSAYLAFLYLKNFILESGDEALSRNIWFTLPQTLEKYIKNAVNVIKVDYTIELSTLRVPEDPDMRKIVRRAWFLPEVLKRTDLISLTPALKLCLQLLQISVKYEEPSVLSAFLGCERFTQKIVSALDVNISDITLTSLEFISILWSEPLHSACLPNNYEKIILNAFSILKILNNTDLALVKTCLVLLEQMLATNFQSNFFTVEGISSDFMKMVFFDLENILIKYLPLISGSVWICLRLCFSVNNQETLVEDALLHEVIKYCLPHVKDTPEMIDFLINWMERKREREKCYSAYNRIKQSYFMITVRDIATFIAENDFENSLEYLCRKILECCDHFLIDTNQNPFKKIRTKTSVCVE